MYRVRLIIALYKCAYPGQYMPNVVDAWDEYVLEDNYDGYRDALDKHEAMVGTDYEWVRELDVQLPVEAVEGLAPVVPQVIGFAAPPEHIAQTEVPPS